MRKKTLLMMIGILLLVFSAWAGQVKYEFTAYHTPAEIYKTLKEFAAANPALAVVHDIAVTPGSRPVGLIEIGPEVKAKQKQFPALFVGANMEGTVPIASEAAIYLVKLLLDDAKMRQDKTWYILPVGNPDAAQRYFNRPLVRDGRNDRPYNDDMDDKTDEDGLDDLDKNGYITMMRVKHPDGTWVPVPGEPRLMKRADWKKGEKGIYKLYSEGIDNDGDGEYNEDGPGGVNVGVNFPHLFKFFQADGGTWAGSEEESFNLIKFICQHPEIAMVFTFGSTNFCLEPPPAGRKGSADFTKIKIPENIGKFMNIDTSRTYTMDEIMEAAKRFAPEGMDLTESMVASFLGLGAVVNPLPEDLEFYKELSEKYKEFLKTNKLDGKRLDPARDKDGSFELWAYYHLGLPSFSMDFWTLPKVEEKKKEEGEITADKLENMTNDEFVALGEEKIDAFLKSSGAPDNVNAKMLIGAVKGGMMTPKKMAEMMKQMQKSKSEEGADPAEKALLAFNDKDLGGKGFVDWKPFNHPSLGEVEIGGAVPFTGNTPPAAMIENLLKGQVPWVFQLADKLPRLAIDKTEVKALGSGLYQVKAWIENTGFLSYPTAMAQRNNRVPPIVVTFSGQDFTIVEGKKRTIVNGIPGHGAKMVKWLIRADKPVTLKLIADSPLVREVSKEIALGR